MRDGREGTGEPRQWGEASDERKSGEWRGREVERRGRAHEPQVVTRESPPSAHLLSALIGPPSRLLSDSAPGRLTVDELLDKLLLEVLEEEADGTAVHGLLARGLKVLLLADVGHERSDLVALLNEPGEDARGVWG